MYRGWVPKKLLNEEQLLAFISEAKKLNNFWSSLLLFIAYTGCRVSEAVSLRWENIDLNEGVALIWRSKGERSRRVPLKHDLVKLLSERRRDEGWVWPSKRNKNSHINVRSVHYRVKKIGERIGVKDMHPHVLRHTVASLLLAKGVPPTVVRDLLGHASLAVTDVYSHTYPKQLRAAINVLP
ncbi:MAG: site-specific integrase [Candidatus Korarchaeum sp.]